MTEKQNLISEGKAKSLFETSNANELLMDVASLALLQGKIQMKDIRRREKI